MLRTMAILEKELVRHLASFRYLLASGVVAVLAILAALVGAADLEQRRAAYQARSAAQDAALRQLHVYSQLQPLALREPEPLALFAHGVESRLGEAVTIHLFTIPDAASEAHRGNPFLAPFREIDLTTIVRVVLGLAALVITFDTLCGEQETRNLELVLASGARRGGLFAGKLLGAFLALLLPLAGSVVFTWLVLRLRLGIVLDSGAILRLLALCGAYAAYLLLMTLIGMLLSLVSRTSARALIAAVLVWLLLVFLIPPFAVAGAGALVDPRRATHEVEREIEGLEAERDRELEAREDEVFQRFGRTGHFAPVRVAAGENEAVLHRYGSAVYYDALARLYRLEADLGTRYAERIFAVREARRRELATSERLARLFALPSPAFLLDRVAESLAGTSAADQDDFLTACRSFRRRFLDALERRDAFDSWRWFTDDPPPGKAWTTYLGVAPDEVDAQSFRPLVNRYRSELQERFQREQEAYREDPARLLDLEGLPRFRFSVVSSRRALLRVAWEGLLLLVADIILLLTIATLFSRWKVTPPRHPVS